MRGRCSTVYRKECHSVHGQRQTTPYEEQCKVPIMCNTKQKSEYFTTTEKGKIFLYKKQYHHNTRHNMKCKQVDKDHGISRVRQLGQGV